MAGRTTSLTFAERVFYDWQFDTAEHDLRRAIELNPRLAWGHLIYSTFDPLSLLISAATARAYYDAGRTRTPWRRPKTLEIDSTFSRALYWLGMTSTQEGQLADAVREFQLTIRSAPFPLYKAELGHAYAVAGQTDKARGILGELKTLATTRYISPFGMATIYAGPRDKNQTMEWLE